MPCATVHERVLFPQMRAVCLDLLLSHWLETVGLPRPLVRQGTSGA